MQATVYHWEVLVTAVGAGATVRLRARTSAYIQCFINLSHHLAAFIPLMSATDRRDFALKLPPSSTAISKMVVGGYRGDPRASSWASSGTSFPSSRDPLSDTTRPSPQLAARRQYLPSRTRLTFCWSSDFHLARRLLEVKGGCRHRPGIDVRRRRDLEPDHEQKADAEEMRRSSRKMQSGKLKVHWHRPAASRAAMRECLKNAAFAGITGRYPRISLVRLAMRSSSNGASSTGVCEAIAGSSARLNP